MFARIKKWYILRFEHSIHFDPAKIVKIFNIIAACLNDFGNPMYAPQKLQQMTVDCGRIMDRLDVVNDIDIKEKLVTKPWTGVRFQDHSDFVPNFDLDDLRNYSTSAYIIDCCKYYAYHSKKAKKINFMYHKLRKGTQRNPLTDEEITNHELCKHTMKVVGMCGKMARHDTNPTTYQVVMNLIPS